MKAEPINVEHADSETERLVRQIAEWTWDLKALNTVIIDLRGRVSYTDFVVVTTATSDRHVQAIARHVESKVAETEGKKPLGREGVEAGQWALVDFGEVILHIFNGNVRQDYDLERMWPEAERLEIEDKPRELYGHFELQQFEDEG